MHSFFLKRSRSRLAAAAPVLSVALVAILGAVLMAAVRREQQAPQQSDPGKPPLPVRLQAVAIGRHAMQPLALTGRVEAIRRAMVSFEIGGAVIETLVDAGDEVAAGQPLARLDPVRLQARYDATDQQWRAASARLAELVAGPRPQVIDRARAALSAAELRESLAQSTAERYRVALAQSAVSAQDEEAARRDAEVAAARVAEATAQLDELLAGTRVEQVESQRAVVAQLAAERTRLARDLADCELTAPFAARIQTRLVEHGAVVAAGANAFELVGTDLRVRVGVPATFAAADTVPVRATVRDQALALVTDGMRWLPRVDSRARTVDLLIPIRAADSLRDGDLAIVDLPTGERQGIVVPSAALRRAPRGLFRCQVAQPIADRPGVFRVENRDVQVAEWLADGVLVTGGLAAAELLVTSGADHVIRGMLVRRAEER